MIQTSETSTWIIYRFRKRGWSMDDIKTVERALREYKSKKSVIGFNPRPCMRGDNTGKTSPSLRTCFNPRPCMRGDFAVNLTGVQLMEFLNTSQVYRK